MGGTLTNWSTIKGSINKLKILDKDENEKRLTKKEVLIVKKRKDNEILNKLIE